MRVISNNLANVNTTGFKQRSRVVPQTLAYQVVTAPGAASTSGETKYATEVDFGTGVKVQGADRIETQGSLQTTGDGARYRARRQWLFPGADARRPARLYPRGQFLALGRRAAGHNRRLSGDARHHRAGRRDRDHGRHRRHRIGDHPGPGRAQQIGQIQIAASQCGGAAVDGRQLSGRNRGSGAVNMGIAGEEAAAASARACSKVRTSTSSRNWST